MIFGVIYFYLLFSVSTTLKVCIIIIAHKKFMSSNFLKLIFTFLNNPRSHTHRGFKQPKNSKI